MSNTIQVLNAIGIAFSLANLPALVLISLVQTAFGGSFEDHMSRHLEFIFGELGLKGENVISTQVTNVRVLDDSYTKLFSKIALIHQDTQGSIIDIMQASVLRVRIKFNQYFEYGKYTYINGLPTANITADLFPTTDVINTINTQYGVSVALTIANIATPTKDQWIGHKLKDLYGFNLTANTMTYLTYLYSVDYSEYNYTTSKYDVHAYRPNYVTDTVTTTTTISVIVIDATTETKRTVVKRDVSGTKSITGAYTSTSSTTTDVVVTAGSTVASTTVVITYPPIYVEKYTPSIIVIDSFLLAKYFVAQWKVIGGTDVNYWTYLVGSGNPTLDKGLTTANLDMLPIVAIRNNGVNLNSDLLSPVYLQSKELLKAVGMDIDGVTTSINSNPDIAVIMDVFVYFGLEVSSTSPTVSKYLFKVFDYIFTRSNSSAIAATYIDTYTAPEGVVGDTPNLYRISVSEGVYNSSMFWSYQTKNVIQGTIGPVGTYNSSIIGADLVVRGQLSEGSYLEYRIVQLAIVSVITRAGLSATVTKTLLDGPIVMPMCYNIVDQFNSIEQLELFSRGLQLGIYSASVTYLTYYQTPDFAKALQISIIVASVVLFILSLPAGGAAGTLFYAFAQGVLAGFVVSYLLRELLLLTNNPIIKAIIVAAIVAVAIYSGYVSNLKDAGVLLASQITTAVTQYTEFKMDELQAEAEAFYNSSEKILKEIADKTANIVSNLDTGFVTTMAVKDVEPAFIKGPSLTFYQAVQMQHDQVYLSVGRAYTEIPTYYEKAFLLGVV